MKSRQPTVTISAKDASEFNWLVLMIDLGISTWDWIEFLFCH